ncbi:MAG: hypothetical protein QI197_04795 [Candidatus Korarchaeota archaeon]|nr:hypothetical protein [Candidatus Korarchaeota archaeon]
MELGEWGSAGIVLLGVAALIIALLAVHFYATSVLSRPDSLRFDFHAYCEYGTVIIHANTRLDGVRVMDARGNIICEFPEVPAGSDEVCEVVRSGVYVVESGGLKKAVVCREMGVVTVTSARVGD